MTRRRARASTAVARVAAAALSAVAGGCVRGETGGEAPAPEVPAKELATTAAHTAKGARIAGFENARLALAPTAVADDGSWPMATKSWDAARHSALTEITPENVARLQEVWTKATGAERGHEAAPLVVDGTMYVTTPFPNELLAFDAQTGVEKWRYKPAPSPASQGVACCDVVNRGAAYADGRVFFNTLDNHTVAVDASTGTEVWKVRLGEVNRGETMTMAPMVAKGKVFVGNSGGELGVRGWLTALDAATGSIAWRAYTTGPDHEVLIGAAYRPFYAQDKGENLGVSTWPLDKWQVGGGTVWGFVSYDPALDLVYYGTSNPGPWNPDQRPGDNKFTCGVFARDPDDGQARWFYQWSPHDVFDHDGVNENILLELTLDGAARHVLVNAGRNGYVYVLDRETGEVLAADPFAHITTSRGVSLQTGRIDDIAEKAIGTGKAVRDICPASPGAKDWQPAAFSPSTGLLYIPANNLCQDSEGYEVSYIAGTPYVGANVRMYAGPGGNRGELIGWDVAKGEAAFRIPERFPVWSGVVVTASNVAFYGTMDGTFKAIDARDGKVLWQKALPSGVVGQPVTFKGTDGKQYVAVLSGVGGWAGAVVAGNIDTRDKSAALGFTNAMADLKQVTKKGGAVHVFALP